MESVTQFLGFRDRSLPVSKRVCLGLAIASTGGSEPTNPPKKLYVIQRVKQKQTKWLILLEEENNCPLSVNSHKKLYNIITIGTPHQL